jgi:hypothetical protein
MASLQQDLTVIKLDKKNKKIKELKRELFIFLDLSRIQNS